MFSDETTEVISQAASRIGLDPAILLAVVEVESGGRTQATVGGRSEPVVRFEGHYFDRRLSPPARDTARREGLAAPEAGAVRNPAGQAARWRLIERAAEIDRGAAYESTSWGIGQVMGAHWAWLGYSSVEALVEEARSGLEGQLRLMLRYIEKAGLMEPLRRRDWTAFARGYNGPGFARNSYHLRLALAYRRFSRREQPSEPHANPLRTGNRGAAVRNLQVQFCALGYPVQVDGVFGPETHKAVLKFQRRHSLVADGIVGPRTRRTMDGALPRVPSARTFWSSITALGPRLSAFFSRWPI